MHTGIFQFAGFGRMGLAAAALTVLAAGCGGCSRPDASTAPKVSERAPAFQAKDQTGTTRSLEEFRGKHVVLYFYPKDATPGCTKEACAFRDRWSEFEAAGASVLGVSLDSVESHAEFAKEHGLSFPLLADEKGTIAAAYGVPTTLGLARRMTFIIDKHGVIRRIFPDVDPAVHAEEVLATLRSLGKVEP